MALLLVFNQIGVGVLGFYPQLAFTSLKSYKSSLRESGQFDLRFTKLAINFKFSKV